MQPQQFKKLQQAFELCPAPNRQNLIVRELEENLHTTLTYHYKPFSMDGPDQ